MFGGLLEEPVMVEVWGLGDGEGWRTGTAGLGLGLGLGVGSGSGPGPGCGCGSGDGDGWGEGEGEALGLLDGGLPRHLLKVDLCTDRAWAMALLWSAFAKENASADSSGCNKVSTGTLVAQDKLALHHGSSLLLM